MNSIAFLEEWAAREKLRPRACLDIYMDPRDPALRRVRYQHAGRSFILQASASRLIVTGKLASPVFFSVGQPHPALLTNVPLSIPSAPNRPTVFGSMGFTRAVRSWLERRDRLEALQAFRLVQGESLHVARNESLLVMAASRDIRGVSDMMIALVGPANDIGDSRSDATLPAGFQDLEPLASRWVIPDDSERNDRLTTISRRERTRLRRILEPRLTASDEFLSRCEGPGPLPDDVIRLQCLGELGAELKLRDR